MPSTTGLQTIPVRHVDYAIIYYTSDDYIDIHGQVFAVNHVRMAYLHKDMMDLDEDGNLVIKMPSDVPVDAMVEFASNQYAPAHIDLPSQHGNRGGRQTNFSMEYIGDVERVIEGRTLTLTREVHKHQFKNMSEFEIILRETLEKFRDAFPVPVRDLRCKTKPITLKIFPREKMITFTYENHIPYDDDTGADAVANLAEKFESADLS